MKFAFGPEEGRNRLHAALMIVQSKSSLFYRIPTDEQHSKLYPAYALEHVLQTGSIMLISLLVHCQLIKQKGSYFTLDSIGFQSFQEEYKDTLHVEVVKYRPDKFDSCAKRPPIFLYLQVGSDCKFAGPSAQLQYSVFDPEYIPLLN